MTLPSISISQWGRKGKRKVIEPIKKGDECIVVGALGRHKSPNIGKRVVVGEFQGEHSQHGRIVRCTGEGIVQLTDSGSYQDTGWADFAVAWLQKADPQAPKDTVTDKKLERVE